MGSQSSSGGAGPEEEEREEGQGEDDVDLRRVLALLLGRGRSGRDPSDEEEEEAEEEPWGWGTTDVTSPGRMWEGLGAMAPPLSLTSRSRSQAPPPPDTRALDGHVLKAQLLLARGKGAGPDPPEEHVTRLLRKREWGRCRNSSFSYGERSLLSSHFLPNHEAFSDSYPQKAFCGLFSPDGSLFVSACQDHTLRFYWSREGSRLRPFRSCRARDVGWSVLDVAFSPDGTHCFYCSWAGAVHVFDIYGEGDTHTALDFRPEERRFAVFSLAVGPDGREVLGGGSDGCIYVYDREVQRRTLRVEAHEDDVNAVALADAGGQLLLSGGDDGVIRAWDLRCVGQDRALPVGLFTGHRDGVTFLHPRGDGRYVVSNSKDQSAKLWDLRLPGGPRGLEAARRAVARQSWDYRWQRAPPRALTSPPLPGDTSLMTFRGHVVLNTLLRCRLAPPPGDGGGQYLSAGCATGAVIVYDVLTGKPVRRLTNHSGCVRDVSWHPQGGALASASWDGSIRLWTYQDPQEEPMGERHGGDPP